MVEQNNSLIDTKGLSEPITKLIDAISKTIGVVYEPTQVKRIAKATAEAEIIKAKTEIDINLLKERASKRIVHVETKRQENIESINKKAFGELPEKAAKEPPSPDWMYDFYNLCQDVSDKDLQHLWAKILAGEVSSPGQYSLRTLQVLKSLTLREAELFLVYCGHILCFKGEKEEVFARVIGIETNDYLYNQMSHMDVLHLAELGLISYKDMKTYVNDSSYQQFNYLEYFHHTYQIKDRLKIYNPFSWYNAMSDKTIEMEFLTELGIELMSIAEGEFSIDYIHAVEQVLKFSGIKMTEIYA